MGLMIDLTKITSATAGTAGTNDAGTAQALATLTGFTYVPAPSYELWPDATSAGFLCQTNDASTCSFTIDATSGANAPFSDSATTKLVKYHRVSFWVRAMRTDKELAAQTQATIANFTTVVNAGATYRAFLGVMSIAQSGVLSNYTQDTHGLLLHVDVGKFNCGTGGFYNTTENGWCRNSSGVAASGGPLNGQAIDAQTPSSGGYIRTAANVPFERWNRWDLIIDVSNGTYMLAINGYAVGYFDYATLLETADTSGTYPKAWLITLPAWTGVRWHVGAMQSWGDTAAANDTGLTALTVPGAWKSWGLSPSFTQGRTVAERLGKTLANATHLSIPYSVNSGDHPFRERGRFTASSGSGVLCTLAGSNLPVVNGGSGYHHICSAFRFEHDTWSASLCFNQTVTADFTITGAAGVMSLKDSAGTTLATWAVKELIEITWTIAPSGACFVSTHNASKHFDSTSTISSAAAVLAAGTDLRTRTDFFWTFTTTTNGSMMEYEAIEGYAVPGVLGIDSYVDALTNGTGDYVVSTFTTACKRSWNQTGFQQVGMGAADGNAAAACTFPSNPTTPKWAFPRVWGRSGKKLTTFSTNCLPQMNYLYGHHLLILGGMTNDMGAAVDAGTAVSVAASTVTAYLAIARKMLDNNGWFTWMRTAYPATKPNSSYPSSPCDTTHARACWGYIVRDVTAGLITLKRTHPRGYACTIADTGSPDFLDGLHMSLNGIVPAFVTAAPVIGAALGESYSGTTSVAAPGADDIAVSGSSRLGRSGR